MKILWLMSALLILTGLCGCSSVDYGSLEGRVYTSGDRKVQITFPEGQAPEITAGYLESKFTCPDDFEVLYLDRATGFFLVCCAVIPPERQETMDLQKLLQTPDGQKSVSAATRRIIQKKHRTTLNLLTSLVEQKDLSVFQLYSKMTDDAGKQRVGSLFFQKGDRWFWLIYEPADNGILPVRETSDKIRKQLYSLKEAISIF